MRLLFALALFPGVVTLGTGRTTMLQDIVHRATLAAFLFLAIVPWPATGIGFASDRA